MPESTEDELVEEVEVALLKKTIRKTVTTTYPVHTMGGVIQVVGPTYEVEEEVDDD